MNTQISNTAHLEEIKKIYDRVLEHQLFSDLEFTLESFMQPLTRIELAQMIVAMSEKLGWELQSEKVCVYQDVSDASEAMRLTAQQVCQLDIMGIHPDLSALDNFMPDTLVTRDQMVTVVSRILR
ncbi:MAG: hypothetical protein Q4B28_00805 [bacterium]|nr:hypothetical protein [bacterium]